MDPYTECPCGTGKKIKFCCPDLLGDLEKIDRMIEGEQRIAALEYIAKLSPAVRERACMLAHRSYLESVLERTADYEATMALFLQKHPNNPIAMAESALQLAGNHEMRAATQRLQQALNACEGTIPSRVYHSIGGLGEMLLLDGFIYAARAHLNLQGQLAGEKDSRPWQLLAGLSEEPKLSLLAKEDPHLTFNVPGADFEKQYDEAIRLAAHEAKWHDAALEFGRIVEKWPDAAPAWLGLASMNLYLADEAAAIVALRRYAALDESLDDAVEAEARAQLIEQRSPAEQVELLKITFSLDDVDAVQERLLADKRLPVMTRDYDAFTEENQPPPRNAFWLLDRPPLDSLIDAGLESIPNILGDVLLYGPETDRAARLELITYNSEEPAAREALIAATGGLLGNTPEVKALTKLPAVPYALAIKWYFGAEPLSRQQLQSLTMAKHRQTMLHTWPNLKLAVLDGRTAVEAALDAAYRVRLLAAILLLELSYQHQHPEFDFNELRAALGLPTCDPIDPAAVDLDQLSIIWFARLDVEKMADERLVELFRTAWTMRATVAALKMGQEILRRESLASKVNAGEVHGMLARVCPTLDEAAAHIRQAASSEQAAGRSPASWHLAELRIRLMMGEPDEINWLLAVLRPHLKEPNIALALRGILEQIGMTMERAPAGGVAGAEPTTEMVELHAGGEAPREGSGLWTPDQGVRPTPSAAGSGKSSLWIPGRD